MIRNRILSGIAITAMALSACNNDDLTIGSSLTNDVDKLDVTAAAFPVTTRTVAVDSVIARTSDCYFGRVKDPETGAFITTDFMSQFHILETFSLVEEDSIVSKENDVVIADSCELLLFLDEASTFCDSLAAMKMLVSELATPVEDGKDYYSNFDPVKLGYLRSDGLKKSKIITWADMKTSASTSDSETKHIRIPINEPYTAKNGKTYKNYGSYILQQYYEHPEYYTNSDVFTRNICPGFFYEITDGLGFHGKVPYTGLQIHYRAVSEDSIYNSNIILAGTQEVLQTIRITNEQDKLNELAQDNTCTYLKSPAGLFTEVTIPVEDIMKGHDKDSLLAASLSFQRINSEITDNTVLTIPKNVLLICKDSINNFFAEDALADNVTSFTTAYGNSSQNVYVFSDLSPLITHLAKLKAEGEKTDLQWTAKHPDWNKMLLIPIHLDQVSTTSIYGISNTTTIGIEHDMSITSTRLVGGSASTGQPIEIKVAFGKFKDSK